MDAITTQKKLDLLKMAGRQLAEEYNQCRSEEYKRWLGNCETVWRTSGNRLPLTPPAPMPTEAEIVARALRLYNELIAPNQSNRNSVDSGKTETTEVTATAKNCTSDIDKVVTDIFAIHQPVVATTINEPTITEAEDPVESIKQEPIAAVVTAPEPTIQAPAPAYRRTESFADSLHDAPTATSELIEQIVPTVTKPKEATTTTYKSGIYKIFQTEATHNIPEIIVPQQKQKSAKTDSLKNLLTGIFPNWNHQ
ncbi:hypothetical protein UFOVP116_304 [uncultured Caudovirales phage]|uniref:Uncharacterized protein n=1 Tax=uncultured Caudovirales phage TaxID=2100421 RepID=A0A6J5LEV8_9CAUD|nr:hypothetical protein UFOVP116_304 [uncultured Caudovirales phage]